MQNLIVSTSPHAHSSLTTQAIMRDVLIALSPAAVASVVLYGLKAIIILAVCLGVSFLSEFLFNIITKREQTVTDLSCFVTGALLALSLPATANVWHCVVGSVFAIIVVKCLFGGLGCNFANPAVTSRIMLLVAFSSSLAGGVLPTEKFANLTELEASATPLEIIKAGEGELPSLLEMLLGNRSGAIGEGCAIAILLGFIYLVFRRIIKWYVPIVYVGTVFVLSFIVKGDFTVALYEVLGGGLLLAAVFMITDYVTTPLRPLGKVIFAFGCGLITVLIRFWGSYPEGVSFAILLMNILSPYIDRWCEKKPFGKRCAK